VTRSFEDLKAEMLRDPAVPAEYDARADEFEIAAELIAARRRAGLSQEQLARRMGVS
jgi:DNA-binding transcriptional regulator YiaG